MSALWSMFDVHAAFVMQRNDISHAKAIANARMWLESTLESIPADQRSKVREHLMQPRMQERDALQMLAELMTVKSPEELADKLGVPEDQARDQIRSIMEKEITLKDQMRYAAELHAQNDKAAQRAGVPYQGYSRADMWKLGRVYFEHTIGLTDNPSSDDAWEIGMQRAAEKFPSELMEKLSVGLGGEIGSLIIGATRWYERACPVVQLSSHSYAAALAATSLPHDIEINPPWQAFMIDLPSDLIPAENNESDIRSLLVHRHRSADKKSFTWDILLLPRIPLPLLRTVNMPLSDLLSGDKSIEQDESLMTSVSRELTTEDERKLRICTRIALGVCLAMSDPNAVRATASTKMSEETHRKRLAKEPACRVFMLGRPVKVDCRIAIRSYIMNGSSVRGPLTIQFLVRGYWRNQPYGPNLSKRRAQWIEPYWKGPEDAPINVRPHILKNNHGEDT